MFMEIIRTKGLVKDYELGKKVLAKLDAMPVYQWRPKGQNAHVKHVGPMAQDFMKAFGVGESKTVPFDKDRAIKDIKGEGDTKTKAKKDK